MPKRDLVASVDLTAAQFKQVALHFFSNATADEALVIVRIGLQEYCSRPQSNMEKLDKIFYKAKRRGARYGGGSAEFDELE